MHPTRTLAFLVILSSTPAMAQESMGSLRGRVREASGSPVENAIVALTPRAGGTELTANATTTRSTATGRFVLELPEGGDSILLTVTRLGFAPYRRILARPPARGELEADVMLSPIAQALSPVAVRSTRPRPFRNDVEDRDTPAERTSQLDIASGLSGDLTGSIAAALALVPGVALVSFESGSSSVSILGLPAEQNAVTLNGMLAGVGDVPREGFVPKVVLSSYDPSQGGFTGLQVRLTLPSGEWSPTRSVRWSGLESSAQWADATTRRLGQVPSHHVLSAALAGPIKQDVAFWSSAVQIGRRWSTLGSLDRASADAVSSVGVSPDSAARFLDAAERLGIPIDAPSTPDQRSLTEGSAFVRLDYRPGASLQKGAVTYLLAGSNWRTSDGIASRATATSGSGHSARSSDLVLQLSDSRFLGWLLSETTLSASHRRQDARPDLDMPVANVWIAGASERSDQPPTLLTAGGGATGRRTSASNALEVRQDFAWSPNAVGHTVRASLQGLLDRVSVDEEPATGSFTFRSLDDFERGRASSFSRTIGGSAARSTRQYFALGLGDTYQPSIGRQLQFGLRVEGTRFPDAPAYHPLVEESFGVRSDRLPTNLSVSPMLGFSLDHGSSVGRNLTTGPRWTLSGGVRAYRGMIGPEAVLQAASATGLAHAARRLVCTGPATPLPDWNRYYASPGTAPQSCVDGMPPSLMEAGAPVRVFASDFAPPTSWRADLRWERPIARRQVRLSVAGMFARHLDQPGTVDLNLSRDGGFTLPAEQDRSVFVPMSGIDGATGAVSASGSRRTQSFTQVLARRSDLTGESRQVTAGLSYRGLAGASWRTSHDWSAYYTYGVYNMETRGFDASTASDPWHVANGPTTAPTHLIQLSWSMHAPGMLRIGASAQLQSGQRYTPRVATDINGDGFVNDRAFVFDPDGTADSRLAAEMRALMSSAPSSGRQCLTSQLNRIAKQNSCVGPWTARLNLVLTPDAYRLGLGSRGSIRLVVHNVLGAADRLFHGASRPRGWGMSAQPDNRLLLPTGFDSNRQAFTYAVNPSFGSTHITRSAERAAFGVTLDVRVDIGPHRETVAMRQLTATPPGDPGGATPEGILGRMSTAPTAFDQILRQRTTLGLSAEQIRSLTELRRVWVATRDSVYRELLPDMVEQAGSLEDRATRSRWHAGMSHLLRSLAECGEKVEAILTPEQWARVPTTARALLALDAEQLRYLLRTPLPAVY